jgi:ankyrin repeat protein
MLSQYRELPIIKIASINMSNTTLKECNMLEEFKSLLDASNDLTEYDISLMLSWAFGCKPSKTLGAMMRRNNGDTSNRVTVNDADVDVIKLLAEKIDVNFKINKNVTNIRIFFEEEGDTILMWAVREGIKEIVEFLLNRGADANLKNNNGKTALMFSYKNIEITKLLMKFGAKVNEIDNAKMSPLMWIILKSANNTENKQTDILNIVEFLITQGAEVNLKNEEGWTALMLAQAKFHDINLLKLLVDSGAILNDKSNNNSNALMCLANAGCREGFDFLISPNLNYDDQINKHEIWYKNFIYNRSACDTYQGPILRNVIFFLGNGTDIDLQNDEGWTALMFAVMSGNRAAITLLLTNKANVSLINKQGNSVLDIVLNLQDKDIINLFAGELQKKLSPEEFQNLMSPRKYNKGYTSPSPQFSASPQISRNYRGGRGNPHSFYTNSSSFHTNNSPHARGGRGGSLSNPTSSSQTFFANPPSSLLIFSNNLDEIGKKILKIAENKPPYWEVLSQRLGISDKESRKELGSLQMELRIELNRLLSEQNSHLLDAIKSAKARGLISKETATIFKNINEAANQAKHENDNLSSTASVQLPPSPML